MIMGRLSAFHEFLGIAGDDQLLKVDIINKLTQTRLRVIINQSILGRIIP